MYIMYMFCIVSLLLSLTFNLSNCATTDDQVHSKMATNTQLEQNEINNQTHVPRFGFPINYGNDIQGYSGGSYTPVKIELGGLFLGTIIGLGAVLLIPKLSQLFTSPYGGHGFTGGNAGGYFRNLPDSQNILDGLTKALARFDETLKEHHIDSMSCLERAACSYAKSNDGNNYGTILQESGSISIVKFITEGTKLKTALDRGKSGEDCTVIYPNCSFSKQLLMTGIKSAILDNKL